METGQVFLRIWVMKKIRRILDLDLIVLNFLQSFSHKFCWDSTNSELKFNESEIGHSGISYGDKSVKWANWSQLGPSGPDRGGMYLQSIGWRKSSLVSCTFQIKVSRLGFVQTVNLWYGTFIATSWSDLFQLPRPSPWPMYWCEATYFYFLAWYDIGLDWFLGLKFIWPWKRTKGCNRPDLGCDHLSLGQRWFVYIRRGDRPEPEKVFFFFLFFFLRPD